MEPGSLPRWALVAPFEDYKGKGGGHFLIFFFPVFFRINYYPVNSDTKIVEVKGPNTFAS